MNIARVYTALSLTLVNLLFATSAAGQTDNTAYGSGALISNTTGDNNSAFGHFALRNTTTGSWNTAVGDRALTSNVSAWGSTAVGHGALYTSNGAYNTAVGLEALVSNTSGTSNSAFGENALSDNTTGIFNVAVGGLALLSNSTGFYNTAVGRGALSFNMSGSYNTAVGINSGPTLSTLVNTGAFGNDAVPTNSNQIRIGNTAITQIGGQVGWSNLSDARFKAHVTENVPGLEFITKLRPVTFTWDMRKLNAFNGQDESLRETDSERAARETDERKLQTGFLAQEVEAAAARCDFEFSGVGKPTNDRSPYQLTYAEFVVPLVKAVQEQQKQIEQLSNTIATLELQQRTGRRANGSPDAILAGIAGDGFGGGALALGGAVSALILLARKRGKHMPQRGEAPRKP